MIIENQESPVTGHIAQVELNLDKTELGKLCEVLNALRAVAEIGGMYKDPVATVDVVVQGKVVPFVIRVETPNEVQGTEG